MAQKIGYINMSLFLALAFLLGQQLTNAAEIIIGDQQEQTNIPWCGG
jgi:hypothetical protein